MAEVIDILLVSMFGKCEAQVIHDLWLSHKIRISGVSPLDIREEHTFECLGSSLSNTHVFVSADSR